LTQQRESYRQILRSSSVIGGASVVSILMGMLRTKVVAIVLGPSGVGLIGLLQNLMGTASTIASLGLTAAGTRQIAGAVGDANEQRVDATRRALFWGALALSAVGAIAMWSVRGAVAIYVLGDTKHASQVGWLSIGVALTVAASAQAALLNGLRRIGDLARISIGSSILTTVFGIGAISILNEDGALLFVLSAPLCTLILGHWFVARLPGVQGPRTSIGIMAREWMTLGRVGVAFMISGVAGVLGQLLVRTLVQRELGSGALGHFQAAWGISMTYVGFVLGAMGTDYYPRLTALIHDKRIAVELVNQQTEVALLLAGPIFVALQGVAPWAIELLYSSSFDQATSILRWQIIGDLFKIASWPLGFVILAGGAARTFMVTEVAAVSVFVFTVWLGLPFAGVEATGIAFLAMYAGLLPLVYALAVRRLQFSWTPQVVRVFLVLLGSNIAVCTLSTFSRLEGCALGLALSGTLGLYAITRLNSLALFGQRFREIRSRAVQAWRR
jgi:O-antigen/teichoic acid export membrane protein